MWLCSLLECCGEWKVIYQECDLTTAFHGLQRRERRTIRDVECPCRSIAIHHPLGDNIGLGVYM